MRNSVLAGAAAIALLTGLTVGVGAQSADPISESGSASSLVLGQSDVREVNQLIALGFDPGPADGQIGPATTTAAQRYDQSRGGTGRVSIDGALLARLKADKAPRLSYEQVAERSRARQQTQATAPTSSSIGFGSIVQQMMPLIGAAISNSQQNDRYYGPGYYPPRGYYYDDDY